ncbi:general negative regulator of transcription subunit 3-like [Teratosphaeria destructans]|uniref:General negative regulator of transcription subunit n=1 Tax=Teratosphaeria destructans TaxID=418781 RepID=A0A9W7SLQ9_9PEZI|nr:general negative regulator of transcription subunit 3-like [Teratosphaeria destructans]
MAARKLQAELDREFKVIKLGIEEFDGIHDKLLNANNVAQKNKAEDDLKRTIKKLQRSRDKVKGWASQNDIKDKKPLLDQRKLIESRMEMFKAVEKEMKTKAFSKEGLSAAQKLDPKEVEKMEVCEFLSSMVDELGLQIEALEAEAEGIQATLKKKKSDSGKAERLAELERVVERHKWHSGKLEILLRSLENGSVRTEEVKAKEDDVKYYVEGNSDPNFMEDDSIYDEFNLEEEEDFYGLTNDMDKVSSQDAQSVQDEPPDTDPVPRTNSQPDKGKSKAATEGMGARRPSTQHTKTPLPALSTLHSNLPSTVNGKAQQPEMKPAPLPTIPTGQTLKYASAAAAAAASDKNGVGIAPLPPPPGAAKAAATPSPTVVNAQPVEQIQATQAVRAAEQPAKQPTPGPKEEPQSATSKASSGKPSPQSMQQHPSQPGEQSHLKAPQPPSPDSGVAGIALSNGQTAEAEEEEEEESIYHLPSSLTDLLDSFEETKKRAGSDHPFDMPMLTASRMSAPTPQDAEKPNHYRPQNPYAYTPAHYPQEPLGIFEDPRLYSRIDTDSLFYAFYYRQGTYQQYLAAKALKSQSWRFHKQYQTWFQRHEEPKNITEEFEQGTYRFFDYESTWMNRRKADFKFAYKFLEDDL